MKQVLFHWFCFLPSEDNLQTVREVFYLADNTIQYRSNDIDGQTRYYNDSIPDFEVKFKVNMSEVISSAVSVPDSGDKIQH